LTSSVIISDKLIRTAVLYLTLNYLSRPNSRYLKCAPTAAHTICSVFRNIYFRLLLAIVPPYCNWKEIFDHASNTFYT
jgi:hypothetical protein